MYTVAKINKLIQSLAQEYIPAKLRQRFLAGAQGLSLQAFQSLNANGRSLAIRRKTGEMRMYRLCRDRRWPLLILQLIIRSHLPHIRELHLVLDHSDFGKFRIAVLAVSLGKGRSLPPWCQVTKGQKAFMRPLLAMLKPVLEQLPLRVSARSLPWTAGLPHLGYRLLSLGRMSHCLWVRSATWRRLVGMAGYSYG